MWLKFRKKMIEWWNCEDDKLPFWEESDYAEEDHELNSDWPSEKFKHFSFHQFDFLFISFKSDLISVDFHWKNDPPKSNTLQPDLEEKPERELAHDSRLLEVGDSQDSHDFAIETADVANHVEDDLFMLDLNMGQR